ncbi:prepilin-type N-terminal cleavage/methylation domain-containing protein [Planococcus sp. N064]|uniref:Prepilin-type N-terminal cleavage/methylation domain-containing protein n=1 Tax=Planococcus liqunii TaxID=3058394 RepID=A0ABT8MQE5_9BACL|nr:prepilin-type N-terminal cleavage/methylation domain-containing protein [Planococcus sp. N064]MDN7226964.1 prepilin-type N-terminal cleavage/methylation domain-containing protein [Planococcus sp. N064]
MKKFLQKKLKEQKGMTLIELLAVIVIIAIIAAIAIPAIGNIIENSRVGTMKSDNLNAIAAAELYILDYPEATTVTLDNLVGTTAAPAVYLDDKGSLTAFTYTKASKTVVSTAKQGTMNFTIATPGATKTQINNYVNSSRAAANNITASKTP